MAPDCLQERPDGGLPQRHRVVNLRCVCVCVCVCIYRVARIHPRPRGQSPQPLESGGAGTQPPAPPAAPGGAPRAARRRRRRPPAGSCLGFWVQMLRARRELTARWGGGLKLPPTPEPESPQVWTDSAGLCDPNLTPALHIPASSRSAALHPGVRTLGSDPSRP